MATVIQIKRGSGTTAPTTSELAEGELAYTQDRTGDGANSKLYIESVDSGSNPVIHAIGGKYYTDIIEGTTATPADFTVGNGTTSGGSIKLAEDADNGSNFVALKSPDSLASSLTWTLPSADGTNAQVLATNGSGTLEFISTTSTVEGAEDTDISGLSAGHVLVWDGTDSFDNVAISGDATLAANGAITISDDAVETAMILDANVTLAKVDFVVDEDDMVSDSNTKVPTQQSVKAYVDSQITSQDVDIAGDSGTGSVDLDSQTLTVAGTTNEIETSVSGQTVTIGLPNDVTIGNDLTVTGTLTSDDITSTNISIDGNATVTGNLTVQGTTTTIDSTTVSVADPVFEIGDDTTDDNLDRGIKFKYNDGAEKIGFFGYDESTNKFTALVDATDTASVFSGTAADAVFGEITASNITSSGDISVTDLSLSGSITSIDGSAPTAGQLLIGNGTNGDMELATLTEGSNGVTITNADGSVTIENDLATTSTVGVASFSSTNFSVTSGSVSITAIDGGTY